MKTKVKICGITNLDDALFCASAGANYLGFIFYSKSPRLVEPSEAKKIISELPPTVTPVGVFVNENRTSIQKIVSQTAIQVIQLSGDELPEECDGYAIDVWKAFRINNVSELTLVKNYSVSAVMLDGAKNDEYGGTGTLANVDVAVALSKHHKLILAGGLRPDNIQQAIRTVKPFAVDVNSGVEHIAGKKDHSKVKSLFEQINQLEYQN